MALVYKGLADTSLLATYSEERLPVARAVLDRTTAWSKFALSSRGPPPSIFTQLGVNYRWSSIVVDEQDGSSSGEEMAAYLPESNVELRAGDRAPDAPGLKLLAKADGDSEPTSLFAIFKPTRHTALLFDVTEEQAQGILDALSAVPTGTFHTIAILSSEQETADRGKVNEALVDKGGHAFAAYHPVKAGFKVFLVRPDGALAAVVKGREGVEKYLEAVFKA